jgi:hypothetical protein
VRRRGRPPILDGNKQREILAIVSVGCSQRVAAGYVHCSPRTIRRTARRDPAFADRLQQARHNPEIFYLKSIQKAARKEQYWRAAAWALERTIPEKYARRGPDVITAGQIGVLMAQFAAIIVNEVPVARYRKNILRRLDVLCTSLGITFPKHRRTAECGTQLPLRLTDGAEAPSCGERE